MHCAKCFFYESDVGDEVCNRCGRAYLPEANVYLGLVLLVTGGAAWTLRNLLTGAGDPFVRPALDLGAWATWPVSIVDRPAYGLVLGGWLAMLAAAPILGGVLYGKRGGWLLVILIALAGPSLALAAVTALGVWIAAGWTLRLQSKLTSALAGLAPVAVYWFVATAMTDFGKAEPPTPPIAGDLPPVGVTLRTLAPALRSLAYVPAATATILAVLAALVFVGIGRADRWHVRWPAALLTVLVAGPVLALVAFVGVDEVRYGLLREPLSAAAAEAGQPTEIQRFQQFLDRCSNSPRAAEVGAHLALDVEQIENGTRPGTAPRRSEDIWQDLLAKHAKSPWANDARLHLGDAAATQGLFEQAEDYYGQILRETEKVRLPAEDPLADFNLLLDLFTIGGELRARDEAERGRAARRDALVRLALIQENRKAIQTPGHAMALYFEALSLRGTNQYRARLLEVAKADPTGPLADNVAHDLATLEPDDLKRVDALRQVIAVYPGTDGALLAHLGAANTLMNRGTGDQAALSQARTHLEAAQADLAARAKRSREDYYVRALRESVEQELVYVQAQLRTPERKNEKSR